MSKEIHITREPRGAFKQALSDADKGDRILYHIGAFCGGNHKADAAAASDAGLALLFCRKVRDGVFAYLAVKR